MLHEYGAQKSFLSGELRVGNSQSQLTALRYGHRDLGSIVGTCWYVLDLPHDQEAVDNSSKDDVLSVEKVALGACDKKLTSV